MGLRPGFIVRVGSIWDIDSLYDQSWKRIAQAIGGHLSDDQQLKLRRLSMSEALDKMLLWNSIGLNPTHKEILTEKAEALFVRLGSDRNSSLYASAGIAFLNGMKQRGFYPVLLAENETEERLLRTLDGSESLQIIAQEVSISTSANDLDSRWWDEIRSQHGDVASKWIFIDRNPEYLVMANKLGLRTTGIGAENSFRGVDQVIAKLNEEGAARIPI